MKSSRTVRQGLILACIAVGLIVSAFLVVQVNAQNQSATVLTERLKQKDVPVKSVTVLSRLPFEVSVTLQSSSNEEYLTFDDPWVMQLARREMTLAYRKDIRVSSYTLTILNSKGEVISWEQNYLYPSDLSQQTNEPLNSKVDNATAAKIVEEQLQLAGMSLDKLEVTSDPELSDAGQVLFIQLSVPDLETANRSLLIFLDSLFQTLENINSQKGTHIVLCRLKLIDRQGEVLLSYVQDLETYQQQWSAVKGLTNEWYPHPENSEPSIVSPTSTPSSYPAPAAEPTQAPAGYP